MARSTPAALLVTAIWILVLFLPLPSRSQHQPEAELSRPLPGSKIIESLAESLDERLAGEKYTQRRNETTLRVENTTLWEEGGAVENQWNWGLSLHLPNLEDHWALKFDSYDAREEERRLDQRVFRRTVREDRPGARVSLLRKLGDVDTAFEPRLELKDPLGMSYLLKLTSAIESAPYVFRPKLELFARADRGTGVFAALDLNRILTDRFTLQFLNEGEYQDHGNLFTSNTGVVLHHMIYSSMFLGYGFAVHSFNRPQYHLEQYGPSVTYDIWFLKSSLLSSLTTYLSFERGHRFKGSPGLLYTLAATF